MFKNIQSSDNDAVLNINILYTYYSSSDIYIYIYIYNAEDTKTCYRMLLYIYIYNAEDTKTCYRMLLILPVKPMLKVIHAFPCREQDYEKQHVLLFVPGPTCSNYGQIKCFQENPRRM